MLNVLKKDFLYTYIPGSPGVCTPNKTEPVTSIAGWSSGSDQQITYTNCTWDVSPVTGDLSIISNVGGYTQFIIVKTYNDAGLINNYLSQYCNIETVSSGTTTYSQPTYTCTPATPAQTLVSNNIGWNAGAISAVGLADGVDGGYSWKIALSTTGVVVGLASANDGVGIADINHGFYYSISNGLTVMEGGSIKKSGLTYSEGQELRVMRINGTVTYWVNGVKVFTGAEASTGVKYLDVSLYTAGDYVYDPDIFYVHNLSASLTSSSRAGLSRNLRARLPRAEGAVRHASLRNGQMVDLRVLANSVSSKNQAKMWAIKQLSAKE